MSDLKWKPCGWRIVIDPEYSKTTDWGLEIIQPDRTGIAATTKGKVVAMGDACFKDSRYYGVWCKVGDVVLYARYGGVIIEDPDTKKKYVILNDEDLLSVYKTDEELKQ